MTKYPKMLQRLKEDYGTFRFSSYGEEYFLRLSTLDIYYSLYDFAEFELSIEHETGRECTVDRVKYEEHLIDGLREIFMKDDFEPGFIFLSEVDNAMYHTEIFLMFGFDPRDHLDELMEFLSSVDQKIIELSDMTPFIKEA